MPCSQRNGNDKRGIKLGGAKQYHVIKLQQSGTKQPINIENTIRGYNWLWKDIHALGLSLNMDESVRCQLKSSVMIKQQLARISQKKALLWTF